MHIPNWAPRLLVEWLEYYEKEPGRIETDLSSNDAPDLLEMWHRLLTRSEMEQIWPFIESRHDQISLIANGGILGTINRAILYYVRSRKVSEAQYKDEMSEIASLASTLSRKIANYSANPNESFTPYNPFYLDAFLTNDDLVKAENILSSAYIGEYELTHRRFSGSSLREHLPPIEKMLERLARIAKVEAEEKYHRLDLPKKVNDANAFRTYFVKQTAGFFVASLGDFSPTRISTFCSVALDDSSITPDLVRKAFPLDQDTKSLLKSTAKYWANPDAYREDPED